MASNHDIGLGLGIDAGGTQTRWALARADGSILAEGVLAGLSALQMSSEEGRAGVRARFAELAAAALPHGAPARAQAGLTGFGGDSALLQRWLAEALGLDADAIHFCSDMDIAYRACFAPGAGYLVYAGTGSIGAFIDADGVLHRAGGRGVLLDDGGGGFWIAREALRHIWRREDECPGSWRDSRLAQAVFEYIGGDDWACSRQFIYGQDRGAVGRLALAVAASAGKADADGDPVARAILFDAGSELARLAQALSDRFGPRPVALAGRAADLHPLIFEAMRAALPPSTALARSAGGAHYAAARMAAAAPTLATQA